MLVTPIRTFSYWRTNEDGDWLHRQGIVPLSQALQMFRIASHARTPRLRRRARQALVRWRLGELIGERRGAAEGRE